MQAFAASTCLEPVTLGEHCAIKQLCRLDTAYTTQPGAVCWSPDGRQLAVNHPASCVSLYPVSDSQPGINSSPEVILETGLVTEIRWSTNGSILTLNDTPGSSGGLNIAVWDIAERRRIRSQHIPATPLSAWNADFTLEIRAEGNRLLWENVAVEVSYPVIEHLLVSDNGHTAVVVVDDPQSNRPPLQLSRYKNVPQNITAVEVWDIPGKRRLCLYRPSIRALAELHISPNG